MTVSILHPSYGRPEMAAAAAKNWMYKAGSQVEYILCISYQDTNINRYRKAFADIPVKIIYHAVANMVKQLNYAAKMSTGDLLVNVSDDFDCPDKWDELLIKGIGDNRGIAVKTSDGIKASGIETSGIISLPIMDRTYYSLFGYIYHPDYLHFYGDEELSVVADKLERKITLPITFDHIHPITGKVAEDNTNRKNNVHFNTDKATFEKRKAKNFDLSND